MSEYKFDDNASTARIEIHCSTETIIHMVQPANVILGIVFLAFMTLSPEEESPWGMSF